MSQDSPYGLLLSNTIDAAMLDVGSIGFWLLAYYSGS